MIEPEDNIFRLSWYESGILKTHDTTPLNWGEVEMGLSRDFLGIKREVTSELKFDSEASTAVTNALNGNYALFLTLYRKQNDWTMQEVRSWTADMASYKLSKGMVSVSFKSSTAREEIEKNKSTKYDIPLGANVLNYAGIDSDATNIVSGIDKTTQNADGGVYPPNGNFSPSNWLLQGSHSTVEYSPMVFDNCSFTATDTRTIRVYVKLGVLSFFANAGADHTATLLLSRFREGAPVVHYRTFTQNGSGYDGQVFTARFKQQDYVYNDIPVIAGDIVRLYYTTSQRPTSLSQFTASDLRFKVESQELSPYTDYPIQVDTIPTIISALLAKMCTVPPVLNYGLTENTHFLPVLTSAQGLSQTNDPIITISFEDIMKCLFMLYEADYEVVDGSGNDLTLDILPMNELMSDVQAEVLETVNGIELSASDEHVYGTVKVGYETDENAKNGQYDPMCINVFKLGNSEKELDLVCPFKASPTTIEQFIRDKKTSSSTTKDSDTSVFLFCVVPFVDGETTLYRGHSIIYTSTPYLVNSNYFNLPYSPMRILTIVGRYLKVSRWNMDNILPIVSTDRTTQLVSVITNISSNGVAEYLPSEDLISAMQYPLFLPFNVDVEAEIDPFTKIQINSNPRKYYTIPDNSTGNVYNAYINDITLPLTKRKTATLTGLLKYDIPT